MIIKFKIFENLEINQYLVIKHSKFNRDNHGICLMITNNELINDQVLAQIIEPVKSTTFKVYLNELSGFLSGENCYRPI